MKSEKRQEFGARVTQASKSQLTVILYEMILEEIAEAKEHYETSDLAGFEKELKQAQRFVNELMATLNYQYAISYDLLSLYLFSNKAIIQAIMKKNPDTLMGVENVLKKLLHGFEEVSKTDKSGPVMRNTQQLYAGLTYGRGRLNEVYVDTNIQNRGFMA